jgi:hypothetical protein
VTRHAKASSAGSTFGKDRTIGLFVTAFAAFLAFAAPALAAPPSPTIGPVTAVSYASAHVVGSVDPGGEPTYYSFETSTDSVNWSAFSYQGPVAPEDGATNVSADLTGLKGGSEYFVRLAALQFSDFQEAFSAEPNPYFTTLPVAKPTVIGVASSDVSYLSAKVSGSVERPASPDPAFDANCRFEYADDDQFGASAFETAT